MPGIIDAALIDIRRGKIHIRGRNAFLRINRPAREVLFRLPLMALSVLVFILPFTAGALLVWRITAQ